MTVLSLPNSLAWIYYAIIFGGTLMFDFLDVSVTLLIWIHRLSRGKVRASSLVGCPWPRTGSWSTEPHCPTSSVISGARTFHRCNRIQWKITLFRISYRIYWNKFVASSIQSSQTAHGRWKFLANEHLDEQVSSAHIERPSKYAKSPHKGYTTASNTYLNLR